jgi:Drexlerviridae HNH endonuclease
VNWSDYFYYDESSPTGLRWKVDRLTGEYQSVTLVSKDDPTGLTPNKDGYYTVGLDGSRFLVHRIVWELFNGTIGDDLLIDHEDRVRTNNCISNLRLVSVKLNARNCNKMKNNSSGKTGVSFDKTKRRWVAYWSELDGKIVHKNFSISRFGETKAFELACSARDLAVARLNNSEAGYTKDHGQ